MGLTSWFKFMSFATVTALIYIHMQMQIVELAYKGKDKEKKVHDLMDNNGILTQQILTLKSANHLGQELLEKDEGLQFMGHDRVVTFATPAGMSLRPVTKPKLRTESSFWNWLSFLTPLDARAWNQ